MPEDKSTLDQNPDPTEDFFKIIRLDEPHKWDRLPEQCEILLQGRKYGLLAAYFAKFRELLGKRAKSIVAERGYIDKDFRDVYAGFYSRKFATYQSKCLRLHFFSRIIRDQDLCSLDTYQEDYIGYVVVRPTRKQCIGTMIIDPRRAEGVQGSICAAKYYAHILGAELEIEGFPFIAQHKDVTRCAHADCWMVFRYLSQKYRTYREVYPYQITQMTTDYSLGRLVPSSHGLTVSQIAEIFARFGLSPEIYSRRSYNNPSEFERFLLTYISSGLPVICATEKPGEHEDNHAVVALGHVSDHERLERRPDDAGVLTSYDYLQGLVINDDNWQPYQLMPTSGKPRLANISEYTTSDIYAFVVPLYEKMHLTAEQVEELTKKALAREDLGLEALSPSLAKSEVVIRVQLASSSSYKAFRSRKAEGARPPHGIDRLYARLPMPRFIWLAEIASKSSFSKNKVLGEIIWDTTATPDDVMSFLVIHYPEYLIVNDVDQLGSMSNRFIIKRELNLHDEIGYDMYSDLVNASTEGGRRSGSAE